MMNLEKAEVGNQKCSGCKRTIPRDVERISFPYTTRYGVSYIRICSLCLLELSKRIDKKPINKWKQKLIIDAL